MSNMRGVKISNEYAQTFGKYYADTPKAVFAAIAYSFALRLNEGDQDAAIKDVFTEWRILNEQAIVPQEPPK